MENYKDKYLKYKVKYLNYKSKLIDTGNKIKLDIEKLHIFFQKNDLCWIQCGLVCLFLVIVLEILSGINVLT